MRSKAQIKKEIRLAFTTEHLLWLYETTPSPGKYSIGEMLLRIPSKFPKQQNGRIEPLTLYWQEKLRLLPDGQYAFGFLGKILDELSQ